MLFSLRKSHGLPLLFVKEPGQEPEKGEKRYGVCVVLSMAGSVTIRIPYFESALPPLSIPYPISFTHRIHRLWHTR